MANIVDFFEPDDTVVWNKEIFYDEKLFPTLLTTEVYGEGPFTVSWAADVMVPEEIWLCTDDPSVQEQMLKDCSPLQWIELDELPGEWQGYWFRLVKGNANV